MAASASPAWADLGPARSALVPGSGSDRERPGGPPSTQPLLRLSARPHRALPLAQPSSPGERWLARIAEDPDVWRLWLEGVRLEQQRQFRSSTAIYQWIATHLPDEAHIHWRIARNFATAGEYLPPDEKETRRAHFAEAAAWASRGLEIDPSSGESCFYKFAGLGRLAMVDGFLSSLRRLSALARLLEHCLELEVTHKDSEWQPELGNLYMGASNFYRVVPDSFWMKITTGTRGDRRRAVEYSRRAHELASMRIDYSIGLGASLLCLGTAEGDPESLREGIEVLERIPDLPDRLPHDRATRRHARRLIASPPTACRYQHGGWVELDSE